MALVTFSPSNIGQFHQCPRKWWGQREKLLRWKPSPQKERGTAVHETLEQALKEGPQAVQAWPTGLNAAYTQTTLQRLRGIAEAGATLYTEHEMCVNHEFKAAGFWDDDALLRCKADILLVVPGQSALLGDWKTGRVYADSDMQLRTEALLVHLLYDVPTVYWALFYVDQGQTKEGRVDFTRGLAPVQDILNLMHDARAVAESGGPYRAKQNKFCKWCDWYHDDEYCSESTEW